jgi:myo-inositol-1-phosphate synthase
MSFAKDYAIQSENVIEDENAILAKYDYKTTRVVFATGNESSSIIKLCPISQLVTFKTIKTLPKLGLMMVGWGGNNGL